MKKENRASRLIQTSRPTAPPKADAVTLPEMNPETNNVREQLTQAGAEIAVAYLNTSTVQG